MTKAKLNHTSPRVLLYQLGLYDQLELLYPEEDWVWIFNQVDKKFRKDGNE